jgi:DNA-binding response OmpR family regulator
VHIRRLRRALDYNGNQPDLIRTVRSAGYALEENPGGVNYTNPDQSESD